MKEKTIYFLFTDTGTLLSKTINYFTKKSLNHVSISFDKDLNEVYSFGRKNPKNPFSGGFVQEDVRGAFLKDSNCAIYTFQVSEDEYDQIYSYIKKIEADSCHYKYNFLGLFGVLLNIEIKRKNALFCSQFVASAMQGVQSFRMEKPIYFITPADIREHHNMQLIYQGKLRDYQLTNRQLITNSPILEKKSIFFSVSEKVKQFVISR